MCTNVFSGAVCALVSTCTSLQSNVGHITGKTCGGGKKVRCGSDGRRKSFIMSLCRSSCRIRAGCIRKLKVWNFKPLFWR